MSGFGTQFGTFRGKFSYAAPELLEGHEATPASDIYSAGVVLLELILGANPYAAATVVESMHRTLVVSPPKLEGFRPDVPAGLDAVIAQALSKTMEERFASAGAFADALRHLLPRPEDQIAPAFAGRVEADFTGDMAQRLELEPLAERDHAWRSAQPPEPAPRLSGILERAADVTIVETTAPVLAEAEHRKPRQRSLRLWLLAGGLAALGGSVGGAWLVVRYRTSAGPDYVVIERQPSDDTQRSAGPTAPSSPSSAPATSGSPPSSAASVGASAPRTAPDEDAIQTANLSAALQRRQGRIQACFETHVADLKGSPRVTIRFELDAAGKVQQASLEPAELGQHPLGACLLGVARATPFPAPGRPVSFRVPITARVMPPSGPAKSREAGP